MGQGIMRIVTKEFASAGAFQTLAGMNLRAVRMDRLKENFQRFRNCGSPRQANRFQLRRRRLTMRSRLAPTRRAAHAWPREGWSGNAKPVLRKTYGCKSCGSGGIDLDHPGGDLLVPAPIHRLC